MGLQIKTERALVSRKLFGAIFAVFALLLQPLVAVNVPSAFAAPVINEVMPNPVIISDANGEWVELKNDDDVDVDISGWTIAGGTVPAGQTIPAGGLYVLCGTAEATPECDGVSTSSMNLGNNGIRTLRLKDTSNVLVDEFTYDGSTGGQSIEVVRQDNTATGVENSTDAYATNQSVPNSTNNGTPGAENRAQSTAPVVNQNSGEHFTTIQGAIDDANTENGDTITIGNGTYVEAVMLTKSLTLLGESKTGTIIQAPNTITGSDAIVKVSGSGVSSEIRRLTVTGPGPTNCGSIYAGIYVTGGAYAELHNLNVSSIRDATLSGCQNGRAIYVGGTGVGDADITNVTVTDYQKGGIYVSNPDSSATVTNSTITGAGSTAIIAQNGMAAINGAVLNVVNTKVRQNSYAPTGTIATGVLFYNADASSSVDGSSTVRGNKIGVYTTNANVVPNIDLAATSNNGRNVVSSLTGASTPNTTVVVSGLTGTNDSDGSDVVAVNGSNYLYGHSAFSSIQAAINSVASGGTVNVTAGTYLENVNVNKTVSVLGDGAATTSIVGTTANATPVFFSGNNATVDGFTITHDYTTSELSAWNFNNNGVQFGQLASGNTLTNSTVSKSRNGVYINNAQNNKLIGNTITNNRTGINMTNTINGTEITGNIISENWTIGMVMYSSGLAADLSTLSVNGNTFDQNWYTEVLVKDAPLFSGTLDMSSNTFTDTPVTHSTSSSSLLNEPGFAAQQPVFLGGTATKPVFERPTLRIYNSPAVTLVYNSPTLTVDATHATYTSSNGNNSLTLPLGTVITPNNTNWDGIVKAPSIYSGTISLPGGTIQGLAIEVGSGAYSLTLDKAARLLIKDEAGKRVAFQVPGGNLTEITAICSADDQVTMDSELSGFPTPEECKMNVGDDLVIWTKHFTTFVTYSETSNGTSGSNQMQTLSPIPAETTARVVTVSYNTTPEDVVEVNRGDILGSAIAKNTAKTPVAAVEPSDEGWKIWGLAWYWWVIINAALIALIWGGITWYRGRSQV